MNVHQSQVFNLRHAKTGIHNVMRYLLTPWIDLSPLKQGSSRNWDLVEKIPLAQEEITVSISKSLKLVESSHKLTIYLSNPDLKQKN